MGYMFSTATATILSGASLSGIIDCSGLAPSSIFMPAAWTAAVLTFQGSDDGVTFYNRQDSGAEISYNAAASQEIAITAADFAGPRFLKIRSGTAAVPVVQGADRSLKVQLRRPLSP